MNVRTVYTAADSLCDIHCADTFMQLLSTQLLFKVRLNRVYVVRPNCVTDMRPLMSRDMWLQLRKGCMVSIQIEKGVVKQLDHNILCSQLRG